MSSGKGALKGAEEALKGWSRIKHILARGAQHAAIVGVGTGAIVGGLKGYEAIMRPLEFRKDFQAMMDFDKNLGEHDKDQVEARFRTLRTFNEAMSKDPLVASSFVKQTLEVPYLPPSLIGDLTKAEFNVRPSTGIHDIAKAVSHMVSGGGGD